MAEQFKIGDQVTVEGDPRAMRVVQVDGENVHCQLYGPSGKLRVFKASELTNHGRNTPFRPFS